jgi:hypothetical protein
LPPSPTSRGFRPPPQSLEDVRQERLRSKVRMAGWWLAAQGLLYLVLNGSVAWFLRLRYDDYLAPYLHMLALSQLCLGFFLLKSMRDPRRQYLAVDVLILYLIGHVYFVLSYRLSYNTVTPFEWLSGLIDLGLCASLVLHRTRSSQMQGAGSLLSDNALDLALQTSQWIQKKGPAPKPSLGELDAPETGRPNKGSSEAIPHLD